MKLPKEISPLMALYIQETDTLETVQKALELANAHPFYAAENCPASFATFLTESEATYKGKIIGIRVQAGTVYETHRFKAALRSVRENNNFTS